MVWRSNVTFIIFLFNLPIYFTLLAPIRILEKHRYGRRSMYAYRIDINIILMSGYACRTAAYNITIYNNVKEIENSHTSATGENTKSRLKECLRNIIGT